MIVLALMRAGFDYDAAQAMTFEEAEVWIETYARLINGKPRAQVYRVARSTQGDKKSDKT
jgi:hypothetical protein